MGRGLIKLPHYILWGGGLIKCLTIFYGGRINKVTSLYFMGGGGGGGGGLMKCLTVFYGGRVNKVTHYILWG